MEEMYLAFENYGLQKGGIVRIPGESANYLLTFISPEEAQRAVAEKSLAIMGGQKIQLFWYQC